jgi:hypothetical protein
MDCKVIPVRKDLPPFWVVTDTKGQEVGFARNYTYEAHKFVVNAYGDYHIVYVLEGTTKLSDEQIGAALLEARRQRLSAARWEGYRVP